MILLASPRAAWSVDDEAAFVDELRRRGDYGLALEYLDGAPDRGLTSDAFRKRLPYERLVTRLEQVRTIRDARKRSDALADAAESLKKFTASSGDKRLAAEGEGRLAAAYVSIGRQAIAAGKQDAERLESARESLDEARRRYAAAAKLYEKELERYKNADSDSPEGKGRLDLRGRLAQMRLLGARVLHQQAGAHKRGSKEFKKLNEKAAEELAAFYEKYSRWLVGLYAHLYEGQCYLDLGKTKLAAGCFEDLVAQPADDPSFRRLITLAHASLVETRVADGKLEEALRDGRRWLEGLRSGEDSGPDALALAYQLAAAANRQNKEGGAADRRLLGQARQWLRAASRRPNEYREQARALLVEVNNALGASEAPVTSFAEAYQKVRDAMGSLAASKQAVKLAERNNPEVVGELEEEIDDSRRGALSAIEAALRLTEDDTPPEQLNEVRSSQAFLLWEAGDYLRASVIGEFLTKHYPGDPSAEQAANLALASMQRLYQQAKEAGTGDRFEVERLEGLTNTITKNLPGSRAASGAASVLVSIHLNGGSIDSARRVLELVPEAERAPLRLQLASSVWEQAVRGLAAAEEADRKAAERRKGDAAAMLADAFKTASGATPVTAQRATVALYLAQASLDDGDPAAALKVLNDSEAGPLKLVADRSPAARRRGFAAEAYKLALRAYVTLAPPRTDEALRVMRRLEKAVRDDGGDAATQRAKLTRIYFGIGLELQKQITALNERGRRKQAARLGSAFAAFLGGLKEQATDADWTTRQWIGQTYLQLADSLTNDDKLARKYRSQSRDVFQGMIDRASADPAFAPKANSLLAARLQLGKAQSKLGEHAEALDVFCSILAERQSSLDVQKAAAYAFQEWGAASDASQLQNAINGGRLDPKTNKNLVWGWNKLSRVAGQVAKKRPQYKDLFFESWVNIAKCRVLAAEKETGARRDKQLASAKRTLGAMVGQYKSLGGPKRKEQFDDLAKRIQELEGEEPVGLAAYQK